MIGLHVHYVGRGSSNLILFPRRPDKPLSVGVYDCYKGMGNGHAMLETLRALDRLANGNMELAFFAISHYHHDHYIGAAEILKEYGDRIVRFYDSGLCLEEVLLAEHPTVHRVDREARDSLAAIRAFRKKREDRVVSLCAANMELYRDEECGITVRSAAPRASMLSEMSRALSDLVKKERERFRKAREGELAAYVLMPRRNLTYDINKTSSAICIECRGLRSVLGGDVLKEEWRKLLDSEMRSDLFVLSHHGSATGFPEDIWMSRVYRKGMKAICSGQGKEQPSTEVVEYLNECGVPVYQTGRPERNLGRLDEYALSMHYGNGEDHIGAGHIYCVMEKDIMVSYTDRGRYLYGEA